MSANRRKLSLLLCANISYLSAELLRFIALIRPRRRWWIRPINRTRDDLGHFEKLFSYMKEEDHEEFFEFTRMTPSQFNKICDLVRPLLTKKSFRPSLSVELRVAVTLSYLAHGSSLRTEAWSFRIGRSTIYRIVPEVCNAIWQALQPIYLPALKRNQWERVAKEYEEKWQFPNLLGAIDGKHIRVKAPMNSGSLYFNYKKYFSIVLLAACDAKYCFTWVDIGQYGSLSDGGVWSNTDFAKAVEKGLLNIPPPKNLPDTDITTHYAFVGDEAFSLKLYMLRPYARDRLTDEQRIFNYRLSRARRIIENAFGILTARWQILYNTICLNPENVIAVVKALVCLHNYIMITNEETNTPNGRLYCPPNFVDSMNKENGEWRNVKGYVPLDDITRLGSNNASRRAIEQRNILKDYFLSPVGEAQAPWQYNYAFNGINVN